MMLSHRAKRAIPIPNSISHIREQRSAPRVACSLAIELGSDQGTSSARIANISSTGASVVGCGSVSLGQVFQVEFALPDSAETRIRCAGLVRGYRSESDENSVGLEFHNLGPVQRRALADYVRWLMSGADLEEAREHWKNSPDAGVAVLVDYTTSRPTLRWSPGFWGVFDEVAAQLLESDQLFVPVDEHQLSEGERLFVELVPPNCHAVFRTLAEVTWVDGRGGRSGIALRFAGMTDTDRHLLESLRTYVAQQSDVS